MKRRQFIKAALAAPVVGVVALASATEPESTGARISVEEGDPGYDPQWLTYTGDISITCDGKEIEPVITADSREGYVKYYDMDLNRVVRVMRGRVEIKINGRHYNDGRP